MSIALAVRPQVSRRQIGYSSYVPLPTAGPAGSTRAARLLPPLTVDAESLVSFEHVTKTFHFGHERSNARAAIPGRFGEPHGRHAFQALDDVSFTVDPGEAFAIIGPNGAGKSTVLKILAGAVAPTSGRVRRPSRTVSIIELGLGFDPDLTGLENIEYGGTLLGMTGAEIAANREEIIDFAGLEAFSTMPVKRYSTGMLARLGFALATSVDADLFVIDEVLSVGDWEFQRKSLERMRDRHRRGASVIFVSHNLWVVNQLCQRAILLEGGQLTASGPTPTVLAAYLGNTQYTLQHGGVTFDGDEDGGAAAGTAAGTGGAAEWRPVVIRSVEAVPPEIEPGGSMQLRAMIQVVSPVRDHQLVLSMFWEGYATFAIPHVLPSELLEEAGTYLMEIDYADVPASPSTTTWQLAVVPRGEASEDPEQQLPHAIERASTLLTVNGEFTPRPGIYLKHTTRTTRLPEGTDEGPTA